MHSLILALQLLASPLAVAGDSAASQVAETGSPPALAEEVAAADRRFAAAAGKDGVATAFFDHAHPDVVIYRNGRPTLEGRDAVRDAFSSLPPGVLAWEPTLADVARSGDLAYTLGEYVFTPESGEPSTGRYVTIWKRAAGGPWRYVFDTGAESPAAANGSPEDAAAAGSVPEDSATSAPGTDGGDWKAFEVADLESRRAAAGRPYLPFLDVPALSAGLYTLPAGGVDHQQPHTRDEIYVVQSGSAVLVVGDERVDVRAGSVVYVAAGVAHHFEAIAAELRVVVLFAPGS